MASQQTEQQKRSSIPDMLRGLWMLFRLRMERRGLRVRRKKNRRSILDIFEAFIDRINIFRGPWRGMDPVHGLADDEKYRTVHSLKKLFGRDGEKWDLNAAFLRAAESGNVEIFNAFLKAGVRVNHSDPQTGQTAMHIAAASRARDIVRALLKTREYNFLLRDKKGRLASEMAFLYGNDVAMARLLRIKERKRAESAGIKLTRRPRPEA